MQKFITYHGSKIELSSNSDAAHNAIKNAAKNLMAISYERVRHGDTQDIESPLFDMLSACAKLCPLFLIGLSGDSQPSGVIIKSSIEMASVALKSNEVDVALSSVLFLTQLVSLVVQKNERRV